MDRGKQISKPLNTGWIDSHVACVREWVANRTTRSKTQRLDFCRPLAGKPAKEEPKHEGQSVEI